MRKILFFVLLTLCGTHNAHADTIIVMDDNNNIKQQIYTLPHTAGTQAVPMTQTVVQTQPVYVNSAPLPPQQVIVTRPAPVVVVRENTPRNYYYDSVATSALAGFTGAVIGNAVFGHHRHHHHHRRWH